MFKKVMRKILWLICKIVIPAIVFIFIGSVVYWFYCGIYGRNHELEFINTVVGFIVGMLTVSIQKFIGSLYRKELLYSELYNELKYSMDLLFPKSGEFPLQIVFGHSLILNDSIFEVIKEIDLPNTDKMYLKIWFSLLRKEEMDNEGREININTNLTASKGIQYVKPKIESIIDKIK